MQLLNVPLHSKTPGHYPSLVLVCCPRSQMRDNSRRAASHPCEMAIELLLMTPYKEGFYTIPCQESVCDTFRRLHCLPVKASAAGQVPVQTSMLLNFVATVFSADTTALTACIVKMANCILHL